MPDFFATAPRHLESLLADELRGLGLPSVKEARGGARFSGSVADAYRACLWSRVANRVLLPLTSFPATDSDSLYAGASALPWEDHLPLRGTFAIHFDGAERRHQPQPIRGLAGQGRHRRSLRSRVGERPERGPGAAGPAGPGLSASRSGDPQPGPVGRLPAPAGLPPSGQRRASQGKSGGRHPVAFGLAGHGPGGRRPPRPPVRLRHPLHRGRPRWPPTSPPGLPASIGG